MASNKLTEVLKEQVLSSVVGWALFLQRVECVFNIINQICIGFITIYMTWLCIRNKITGTSLHAWLVTIGFHFLMAEGIMCHYGNNILTMSYKHKTKTAIHWMLQVLGGGCGVAGVIVKLLSNKFPLNSLHGKLGFATFIICLISMLSGLVALMSGPLRRIMSPLLNKTFHNFMGIATFVLALLTQFYGYKKHLITRNAPVDFQTLLQCLTIVALVLTCIGPLKALYSKISNICERD